MESSHRRVRVLFLLCAVVGIGCAQSPSDRVDALFARWTQEGRPGAAVLVMQDGVVRHRMGYGEANLEHGISIGPKSAFYLGSVSKHFVAFCIAMLADEGRLSLDDDVRKFLPELPDYGAPITIRHLLHHTSGLRDYLSLMSLAELPLGHFRDDAGIIALLARQKGLNFAPGTHHLYSNSGYFLLGVVVARVSGQSLRSFAQAKLFGPLGMKATRFHDDHTELIRGRADGYDPWSPTEFKKFVTTFDRVGSGGVFSTIDDLVPWLLNFEALEVGSKAVHALMASPGALADGTRISYGFGLVHGVHRGAKTISHGGALGGYRSALLRVPEHRFAVVILANVSSLDPVALAQAITDIYLDAVLDAENAPEIADHDETERDPITRPTGDALRALAGRWYCAELDHGFDFTFRDSHLVVHFGRRVIPLRAVADDRFRAASVTLRVQRDPQGRATGWILDDPRARGLLLERTR